MNDATSILTLTVHVDVHVPYLSGIGSSPASQQAANEGLVTLELRIDELHQLGVTELAQTQRRAPEQRALRPRW